MTRLQEESVKKKLNNRLRRIEGQVRGIQAMINDERECREILQQLTAVRSALRSTTTSVLHEYATDCLLNIEGRDQGQREELLEELVDMLGKTI